MERVRIILQSTENGEEEYVEFSTDFDLPIEDFLVPGCTVDTDAIKELDLPMFFPTDTLLKKEN